MIAVFGCEEEQFLPAEEAPQLSVNDGAEASHSPAAYAYVPEVLQEQVLAAVLPKGWTSSFGTKNADSLQARLSETLTKPTLRTTDSTGLETYSYHVPAEHPLQVINLVITADGDNLLEGSVFVYEMTAEFGAVFQQFEADFSTFEGSLKVFPLQALPKLFYDGLQKTEDDVTDCFELILSQKPVGPNGGGGGDNGGDNGPTGTVSTGDGPIGEGPSGGGGTCAVVITIPCGCDPAHQPGQHCACGTGNDGDEEHNQPYQVIIFVQCDDDDQKSNGDINGKSIDPEDCPQLLSSIGIVPRNLNELPGGEQLTEMIEAAVNETCFNQLAVNHILDLTTWSSCTGGNPANGPDCITQQVVAYLNSLDLGGIPGTPLQIQFSESMPQHQLAAFLNAAVAGEGNEHVYAGMSAALTRLSDLEASNLHSFIVIMSTLKTANFPQEFSDITELLPPLLDNELTTLVLDNIQFFTDNPRALIEVLREFENSQHTISDIVAAGKMLPDLDYVFDISEILLFSEGCDDGDVECLGDNYTSYVDNLPDDFHHDSPLTTSVLRDWTMLNCREQGYFVRDPATGKTNAWRLSRDAGRVFEESCLRVAALPSNPVNYPSPYRVQATVGTASPRSQTRPDAITATVAGRVDPPTTYIWPETAWFEMKAYKNPLRPSTSNHQLGGMISYLGFLRNLPLGGSPSMAAVGVKPAFFLFTTENTPISPALVSFARNNNVRLFHVKTIIDSEGNIELTQPILKTDPLTPAVSFTELLELFQIVAPQLGELQCPSSSIESLPQNDPDPESIYENE